jgi:hypothetical protein
MGAQRRLEELRQEEAAIRAAFPDLDGRRAASGRGRRGRPRKNAAGSTAADASPAAAAGARRQRRRPAMNAAQRKAVSERMKKYWAARRKAKG